jgi:antitoxin component YwqK of YwqJK toxin-antitoxin module
MKKFTLLFCLILTSVFTVFGQEVGKNAVTPEGKRTGYWTIIGSMQKDPKFAASDKVEEGNYQEGQKTGVWKAYYPGNIIKSEYTYVNNRPNGHAIIYNENGKKSEEGTWIGVRWTGDYHLYYEDGTERQAFNYNQVGQRDGKQVYKNPNGTLAIEVTVKAGKEEGWKKEYDGEGHLLRETFFNGGVIDNSKTIEHNVPATTTVAVAPEDPSLDKEKPPVVKPTEKPPVGSFNGEGGPHTLYANGQITQKGTFHQFRLIDGEQRIYDANGLWIQTKLYKNGKYVGDAPLPDDANK